MLHLKGNYKSYNNTEIIKKNVMKLVLTWNNNIKYMN